MNEVKSEIVISKIETSTNVKIRISEFLVSHSIAVLNFEILYLDII